MTIHSAKRRGGRPRRGRPTADTDAARRRGAPTRTRLLALRVLERVQRAADFQEGFEWVESEHFTVSYPERGAPAEAVDAIIAVLESTRRAVMEKIGVVTSYITPVAPLANMPYTMYECPVTHPMSAVHQ